MFEEVCLWGGLIVLGSSATLLRDRSPVVGLGSLVALNPTVTWRSPDLPTSSQNVTNRASFRVRNQGGSPVRILSTRSSCGCAQPEVQFAQLAPGAEGEVTVDPKPIEVGRRSVPITLETDSPSTPEIRLMLQLIGSRKAPYLQGAKGELVFRNARVGDAATLTALTVSADGSPTTPAPVVHSDLPFLEIKLASVRADQIVDYPLLRLNRYEYRVAVVAVPPEDTFSGAVIVVDPWDSVRSETIHVLGMSELPLRAIPAALDLNGAREQRLTVITPVGSGEPRVTPQGEAGGALTVERLSRTDRVATFAVRRLDADAGRTAADLLITSDREPGVRLVVPVRLGTGGAP